MSRRHTVDEQTLAQQHENQEIRGTLESLSGFKFGDKTVLRRADLLAFALVLFHPAGEEVDGVSLPDDQLAYQIHDLVNGVFATLHRNPVLNSEQDLGFWKKVAQRLSGDDGDFPHIKVPQPTELSNILSFYAGAVPKSPSDLGGNWVDCCSIMAVGAVAAWMCALGKLKTVAMATESEEPPHKKARLDTADTEEIDDEQTEASKKLSKCLVGFWNRVTVMLHQASDKQLQPFSGNTQEQESANPSNEHQVSLEELRLFTQEESEDCRCGAQVLVAIHKYLAHGSRDTSVARGSHASDGTRANSPSRYPPSASEPHGENVEHPLEGRGQSVTIAAQDAPLQIVSDIQPPVSIATSIDVQDQHTCNEPTQCQIANEQAIGSTTGKRKHQESMQKFISRQPGMKNYRDLYEQLQDKMKKCSQANSVLSQELEQVKAKLGEAELMTQQQSEAAQHKAQQEVVFLQQQLAYAFSSLRALCTQHEGDRPEHLQKYTTYLDHMAVVIGRLEQVISSGDLVDPAGEVELYLWRFGTDLKRTQDVALAEFVDRLHDIAIYMSYHTPKNDD